MSKWKEQYLQGSFRGVEFFTNSHRYKSGRRLADHVFPGVDDSHQEDMGRKKREINISAYIVDGDYFSLRDNLMAALEKDGPGPLVHPYLGNMEVRVSDFQLTESITEGRVVRFDISMTRLPETTLVSVVANTGSTVAAVKSGFETSMVSEFTAAYNPLAFAINSLEAVVTTLDAVIDIVEEAKKRVSDVAEFKRLISTIKGKLIDLALTGEDLGKSIIGLVDFGNDPGDQDFPPSNAREQFDEMVTLFDLGSRSIPGIAPETLLEPGNPVPVVTEFFARGAISSAAGLISDIDFKTLEDANEVRDVLFAQLDRLNQDPTISDDMIKSIQDTRRAAMLDLDRRILDLSNQVTITLVETSVSLVIAHEIDGDTSNEEEIIERNGVRHPGFVSPVVPIKVVFRG